MFDLFRMVMSLGRVRPGTCGGHDCPLRERCERFRANSSNEFRYDDETQHCQGFVEIRSPQVRVSSPDPDEFF
jgi:hypothetical protein